ncbi:MAG TPA: hypothetical protein VFK02_28670 [Kofleriaceae bacterium]|nr:hypothetical protein [Kofleriaceae bacterium]
MQRLICAIVLLLAACGSDPVIASDDYPTEARDALCRYLARCGDAETADACKSANLGGGVFLRGNDAFLDASTRAALAMKLIEFDSASARACFDALAGRSCDLTSRDSRVEPEACITVFRGTRHDGESCALDDECRSAFCDVDACEMACCTGTCLGDDLPPPARDGEACAGAPCSDGLYCDQLTATCAALRPAGETCLSSVECDYGLDCDLDGGTCVPLPRLGDACTGTCRDEGTTCSPASHTCVEVGLVGDPCSTSSDCSPLYRCDATGRCTAGLPLDSACMAGQLCADDGAFCDVPEGQQLGACTLPRPDDSPCQLDENCQSHVCDSLTLHCIPDEVCL